MKILKSYLQSYNAALDEIARQEFDVTHAQKLMPSGGMLSVNDRLEVLRSLDLERPDFARKVHLQTAAEFDVTAEVQQRDEAMEHLIQELLEITPMREKLVTLGCNKLNGMNAESPYFELRDNLRADLASNETTQMIPAIRQVPIRSEEFAQLISDGLGEMTGLTYEFPQVATRPPT